MNTKRLKISSVGNHSGSNRLNWVHKSSFGLCGNRNWT